jgi:hypothetical protein
MSRHNISSLNFANVLQQKMLWGIILGIESCCLWVGNHQDKQLGWYQIRADIILSF